MFFDASLQVRIKISLEVEGPIICNYKFIIPNEDIITEWYEE